MSNGRKARILIIDDEPAIIDSLVCLLSGVGYEVLPAQTCEEALELLEKQQPDLILSDVNMPNSSGFDFVRALRQSERTRETPIIFVTAMARAEDREHCLEAGANGYVEKPVDPERLLNSIRAYMPAA